MKSFPKLPNTQILGLTIFGIIILLGQLCFFIYKTKYPPVAPKAELFIANPQKIHLTIFNPNDLSDEQWLNLGFTDKEVKIILNYKKAMGGHFKSKEVLKKCYAISEDKFRELSPYILLPEYSTPSRINRRSSSERNKLVINGTFNPNDLTQKDWEAMGFSQKQSASILKYKHNSGGSFRSQEHLKSCYMISEDQYRQMRPYILLPKTIVEEKTSAKKEPISYTVFDPNIYSLTDWQQLGFSQKQAQTIINYKNKSLNGIFRSLADIENCFVISKEKFEEMKPYIRLNSSNFKLNIKKEHTKVNSSVETKIDFSKIDLNQITFQELKSFGFDDKSAAILLGYRKKLGGFVTKAQIVETYNIDRSLAEKLTSIANLDASSVSKYSIENAPEEWLKTHPYFKYWADKIIFCQQSEMKEKEIWKFLKLKPETESRMKLYLKY